MTVTVTVGEALPPLGAPQPARARAEIVKTTKFLFKMSPREEPAAIAAQMIGRVNLAGYSRNEGSCGAERAIAASKETKRGPELPQRQSGHQKLTLVLGVSLQRASMMRNSTRRCPEIAERTNL